MCESFNQSICVYAPKNVYAPILYRSRVYMAVCVRELGIDVAVTRLLVALHVQVRTTLGAFLSRANRRSEYQRNFFQQHEKQRRLTRNKEDRPSNGVDLYKENTRCNCRGKCSNKRCSCVKNKNACRAECGCDHAECLNRANRVALAEDLTLLPRPAAE